MTLAQDITRHFGGEWHGSYGAFPAPGHSRADRGVTVKDADGGHDVLFNSFNGADWREIKDECRRIGLLPERERANDKGGQPRETGWYEYADADGTVLYRTVRIEQMGKRKRFQAQRPDGRGGWVNGLGDLPRVPYRLPDIMAADVAQPIYLVEGERKADKLASWGFTATAVAFGCKGWKQYYAEALSGRSVIILSDNDDEGRGFADRAGKDLERAGCAVHVIDLPGLPEKGDIIDWTGTADDLRALVDKALAGDEEPDTDWPSLNLLACAATKAPAREWLIDGWIPANKATLLAGDGGVGKSLLAQIKATCVALGRSFMGMDTKQANAAYLSWEDDAEELWRRQESICEAMGIPMASLSGRLHLVSYTQEEHPFLVTADGTGLRVTPLGRKLERLVERHNIGLLILDNASQTAGVDHNSVEEVAPFAHWLGTLASRRSGAVVLLHHTNKAGQDYLGSVAYNNQFRSRMLLARPEDCHDPDLRELTNPKANYAQAGNRIELRWFKGSFVREEDLPQDMRAELAETIIANAEDAAFLACLRARAAQGDGREVGPSSGPNYAPSQFEGMPQAKGFGRAKLKRAMDRLYQVGKIKSETVMDRKAKREKTIIVEADEASHNAHNASHNGSTTQVHNTAQRPHNMGSAHTYIINNIGAAHEAAAPNHEKEKGSDLATSVFAADPHTDLDQHGNSIGWNDDRQPRL